MYRSKAGEGFQLLGLGIALFICIVVVVYYTFSPTCVTERLVDRVVGSLDSRIATDGTYDRWSDEYLPEVDSWGHPLRVEYRGGEKMLESVIVCSAGSDGQFGTDDDITSTRTNFVPGNLKKAVNRELEDGAHSIGKGGAKGIIDGIKESFGKKKDGEKK